MRLHRLVVRAFPMTGHIGYRSLLDAFRSRFTVAAAVLCATLAACSAEHAPPIREAADKTGTMVALQGYWISGMSYSLHIWQVGNQQKAVQDQPLERYSWRTAYHAASKTLAVARGNTLTLLKLAPEAVRFGSKP